MDADRVAGLPDAICDMTGGKHPDLVERRAVAALLAADKPDEGLDVELLARALTTHRIKQRRNGPDAYLGHACMGDCCPDIAAEFARIAREETGG